MTKARYFLFLVITTMAGLTPLAAEHEFKIDPQTSLNLNLAFRGYFMDDQRIQWSGLEVTFGSEAAVGTGLERDLGWGKVGAEGLFFLNQPWGKNVLRDAFRQRYAANFDVDTFEISELNVHFQKGPFTLAMGKKETPFGRMYFPHSLNNLGFDAPFIRSEAILWRETGLFVTFQKEFLTIDIAMTTGEEDKDTNSSVAPVGRIGVGGKNWAAGFSAKKHDGFGSENQKTFKNHYGVDFMVRVGKLQLSGEAIHDEYGLKHDYNPDDIFWPRSLYHRDIFFKVEEPITGVGGYLNLNYAASHWSVNANYGEYKPEKIGNPLHDTRIRRGIFSLTSEPIPDVRVTVLGLFENDRPQESWMEGSKGKAVLLVVQYSL